MSNLRLSASRLAAPLLSSSRVFGQTLLLLSLSLGLGLSVTNCSNLKVDPNDPYSLLKEAEEEISTDHFQIAIDKLRAIKNKYAYSGAAALAQLRIADVYFLQESYIEAAGSYDAFKDLHPKHEKTPYAVYRIALSYFKDIPSSIARDLSSATKALEAYDFYLRAYPNDALNADAKQDISRIRGLLADKELSIGQFYFRQEQHFAAKNRFLKIIKLYPETPAAATAQEKLKLSEAFLQANPPKEVNPRGLSISNAR